MTDLKYPQFPILWVDDEAHFLESVEFILATQGITNFIPCNESRDVAGHLKQHDIAVVVLDMNMPHVSGRELLVNIVEEYPDIPVVMVTAVHDTETAVWCMKSGALDYIVKPIDDVMLLATLQRAIKFWEVRNENRLLKKAFLTGHIEHPEVFHTIITRNATMRGIFQYMEAIAESPLPVLITGETGVGKELIAATLHRLSKRKGTFVPVNLAGVDDLLFSDTLFGHVKGGFTGAEKDRRGLIEQAQAGTIFLDEIGDLSGASQVKLLRLLQDSTYYPIGSDIQKISTARILLATNHDLGALMNNGMFRRDLYYRLQTHHIHVPPLKDRKDDLPPLVEYLLEKGGRLFDKKKPTVPPQLIPLLQNYPFPGNIRELESMIYHALSKHRGGVLSLEGFRERIPGAADTSFDSVPPEALENQPPLSFPDPLPRLKECEQQLIREALKRADDNQTLAAQMLGLSRRALNNRLLREKK